MKLGSLEWADTLFEAGASIVGRVNKVGETSRLGVSCVGETFASDVVIPVPAP